MKKERACQRPVYKLLPNECKFFFESSPDETLGICLRKYDVIVRRNIASPPPLAAARETHYTFKIFMLAILIFLRRVTWRVPLRGTLASQTLKKETPHFPCALSRSRACHSFLVTEPLTLIEAVFTE